MSENCTIDGDITFDKTIEIYGKITGTVKIAENTTKAMLVVKKSGVVEGDVFGDDVVIEGEVVGNVSSKNKITIKIQLLYLEMSTMIFWICMAVLL